MSKNTSTMKGTDYAIIAAVLVGVGGAIFYLWRRNKKQLEESQKQNQLNTVETITEVANTAGTPEKTVTPTQTLKQTGTKVLGNILSYLANPPKTTAAKRINTTEVVSPASGSLAPARLKASTLLG